VSIANNNSEKAAKKKRLEELTQNSRAAIVARGS
jgi:hypothetical protein